MKTFATILLLVTGIFVTSSAQTTNSLRVSPSALEIGLNVQEAFVHGTNTDYYNVVAFSAITTNIMIEFTFRNVGEVNLRRSDLLFGLTVIWDGKEYKGMHEPDLGFTGSPEFLPRSAWRTKVPLLHYGIPSEALASGRHTIAVKDAGVESNKLTIFIDAKK
jgi:hypothetical protein